MAAGQGVSSVHLYVAGPQLAIWKCYLNTSWTTPYRINLKHLVGCDDFCLHVGHNIKPEHFVLLPIIIFQVCAVFQIDYFTNISSFLKIVLNLVNCFKCIFVAAEHSKT